MNYVKPEVARYLKDFRDRFTERAFILDAFTYVAEKAILNVEAKEYDDILMKSKPLNVGQLYNPGTIIVTMSHKRSILTYMNSSNTITYLCPNIPNVAPIDLYDHMNLIAGDIANYNGQPTTTTVGRFLINQIVLASVFGNVIPYVNDIWKIGGIEDKIAKALLDAKVSVKQCRQYIDHGFFIGHFAELCVPTLTPKSLMTDPNIAKRKLELIEANQDNLKDPIVLKNIEDELIKLDKEYLGDDPSVYFFNGIGSKAYDVHRKKMFLTVGGIESFSSGSHEYNFIPNSLSEGWTPEAFPIICNEIRKGSYSRGKETQKGGALSKFILRIFQDLEIVSEDCKSTVYLQVYLDGNNIDENIGRYVIYRNNLTEITEANKSQFIGKTWQMRSPMTCKEPNGLCYTCVGSKLRKMQSTDNQAMAIGISALAFSSKFLTLSMKNMHGTKITSTKVDFKKYFR